MIIDRIALILTIIGGINWGSIGLFRFDIVAWICGGQTATVSRVIYTLVGLAALWCISLLFRRDELPDEAKAKKLPNGSFISCVFTSRRYGYYVVQTGNRGKLRQIFAPIQNILEGSETVYPVVSIPAL